MRFAARVDGNQAAIVKGLRAVGATVKPTHTVGQGFPDLVVGYGGKNYLFEVKDPGKVPSARKLTPQEAEFAEKWRGQVHTILCLEDALRVIGAVD